MSLSGPRARLVRATKELHHRWRHVRGQWNDEHAQRLERDLIAPLEDQVRQALVAMEHLDSILHRVKNDCEPR